MRRSRPIPRFDPLKRYKKERGECAAANAKQSSLMRPSHSVASATAEGETRPAEIAAAITHGPCACCRKRTQHPQTASACDAARCDDSRSITTTRLDHWIPCKHTAGTSAIHATCECDALLREGLRRGPRLPTDSLEMEELTGLLLEGYAGGWLELRPP